MNSRFGDLAGTVTQTSPAMRSLYLNRRAEWGRMIRVVDVDLAGLTMLDSEHAVALVDFQWTRVDEGTLHNTRVRQEWSSTEGPWLLTREKRDAGEIGLFGEARGPAAAPSRPDVQFATRVIE